MDIARATEVGSFLHLLQHCKSNSDIIMKPGEGVANSEACVVEFDLSSIFHKSVICGVMLRAFNESK